MNEKQIIGMVRAAKTHLDRGMRILDEIQAPEAATPMPADTAGEPRMPPKEQPGVEVWQPESEPKRHVRVYHTFEGVGDVQQDGVLFMECSYNTWNSLLKVEKVRSEIESLPSDRPIMLNWCEGGEHLPLDEDQLAYHHERFVAAVHAPARDRAGYYNLQSAPREKLLQCGVVLPRATYNYSNALYDLAGQCNYLDRQMRRAVDNGWRRIIPSFNPFRHKGRKQEILTPIDLQAGAMAHLLREWPQVAEIVWWGSTNTAEYLSYMAQVVNQAFNEGDVEVA
jgi:hypothetical protein